MEGRSCGFKRRHFNNENWWRAIKIKVNENRFCVCESSCHLIQLSSKIASFIAVAVIIFPDPRLRASKFIFPAGFCSEINRIFVIVDAEMSHNNKHSLVLYQYQLKMTQTLPFSSCCLQLHQFWSLFWHVQRQFHLSSCSTFSLDLCLAHRKLDSLPPGWQTNLNYFVIDYAFYPPQRKAPPCALSDQMERK